MSRSGVSPRSIHWEHMKKYNTPEDVPMLLTDTVEELEARLRQQFPAVFRLARERERAANRFRQYGSGSIY